MNVNQELLGESFSVLEVKKGRDRALLSENIACPSLLRHKESNKCRFVNMLGGFTSQVVPLSSRVRFVYSVLEGPGLCIV
jgi:hypothetical protein